MNDKNGNKWKRPIEWQEAGREVPEMLSHVPLKKYKGWNKLDDDVDDGHRVRVVDSLERGKFFPTLNYFPLPYIQLIKFLYPVQTQT